MDNKINSGNSNTEKCQNSGALAKESRFDRILNTSLIAVFVLFIFGFAIWSVIQPDVEFSEQENRMLQQLPHMSSGSGGLTDKIKQKKFLDNLFDGSYASSMNKYLSDQFPMRNSLVGVKAATEIALLKRENDDVVLGRDEYIFVREDYPSKENLQKNIDSIAGFFERMNESGRQTLFAPIGRNEDVETRHLPSGYSTEHSDDIWSCLDSLSSEKLGEYINLRELLKDKADSGESVYYRTDHHWTTLGAYYAYREIITALGETPYDKDYFRVETASSSFYGTTWSSSGMKWISPETIEFYRYDGDDNYITSAGAKTLEGFYDRSYLEKKDKYSAFLGGNTALFTVKSKNGSEDRERLLLIKDSFSHSLAPFLALHYDLYILDPRYSTVSISDFIESNDIDKVLVTSCISTLTDAPVLSILDS